MISAVTIENYRGIRQLVIELKPLTVLLGSNGSGKSAVLEAIFAAGSERPAHALGSINKQRSHHEDVSRWMLFEAKAQSAAITIEDGQSTRTLTIERQGSSERPQLSLRMKAVRLASAAGPSQEIMNGEVGRLAPNGSPAESSVLSFADKIGWTRFVAPVATSLQAEPVVAFSRALEAGQQHAVEGIVRALVQGSEGLAILVNSDGKPSLHLTYKDRVVPVAAAGEGVSSLIQLALELASAANTTVCIEEPESFKHPSAIDLTAKALWAAVRQGVQVVLTTHSPLLLDRLAVEARDDLTKLGGYALLMSGTNIKWAARSPAEFRDAIGTINDDLK